MFFSAEADQEAGKDVTTPPPPIELVFLRYRQAFNMDWWTFLKQPWDVVAQDLEIMDIEGNIKAKKMRQNIPKAPTRR